ncbi:hypothetical protein PAHAL_3G323500 [Panicum hallii]|uniref:Uncharacterized protein n=1 Tax=Panicum hallii TaxID=206008 RepID=A0A2T8KK56_9POAL|nr:hypothetical protein PAHAL_3G323500 [Panicum hallii]
MREANSPPLHQAQSLDKNVRIILYPSTCSFHIRRRPRRRRRVASRAAAMRRRRATSMAAAVRSPRLDKNVRGEAAMKRLGLQQLRAARQ